MEPIETHQHHHHDGLHFELWSHKMATIIGFYLCVWAVCLYVYLCVFVWWTCCKVINTLRAKYIFCQNIDLRHRTLRIEEGDPIVIYIEHSMHILFEFFFLLFNVIFHTLPHPYEISIFHFEFKQKRKYLPRKPRSQCQWVCNTCEAKKTTTMPIAGAIFLATYFLCGACLYSRPVVKPYIIFHHNSSHIERTESRTWIRIRYSIF